MVHLAAQQAQAARVVHLLRSPLELQAVATINSELSPLGAATVAALCAEPTHTFQIPAGSVAAGAGVHRRAGGTPERHSGPTRRIAPPAPIAHDPAALHPTTLPPRNLRPCATCRRR